MTENNAALAERCMNILCNQVGVINAERFILYLRNEDFDYTKWQRDHYDAMSPDEIHSGIIRNGDEHPFCGKKAVII